MGRRIEYLKPNESPLLPEQSEGKEGCLVSAEPSRDGVVFSEQVGD
jgi:hypothetical protein